MSFHTAASPVRTTNKTLTFTGAAGFGAATETINFFTVTGVVLVHLIAARATVNLVGAGSISLGTTNQVAQFVAATVATAIDTSELWTTATPTAGAADTPDAMALVQVLENIVVRTSVDTVTGGTLEVSVLWEPLSAGASLVAS